MDLVVLARSPASCCVLMASEIICSGCGDEEGLEMKHIFNGLCGGWGWLSVPDFD